MIALRTLAAAAVFATAAGPAFAISPDSPIPTGMSAGGAEWPTPEPGPAARPGIDRLAPAPSDRSRGDGMWAAGTPTFTFDFLPPRSGGSTSARAPLPRPTAAPAVQEADRSFDPRDEQTARR